MAGNNFSSEGNKLYKSLANHLIEKGVCIDYGSCWEKTNIYREDDTKIRINMYNQKSKNLASVVAQFLIENGISITEGKPITLKAFSESKDKHLGVFGRKDQLFKLEIEK